MNLAQFHEHRDEQHSGALARFPELVRLFGSVRILPTTTTRHKPPCHKPLGVKLWAIIDSAERPIDMDEICDAMPKKYQTRQNRQRISAALSNWVQRGWLVRFGIRGNLRYSARYQA